jgi:ubiquitin-activating enzyme E1 C
LYDVVLARAKEFKIEGVTWSLTQGVVKISFPRSPLPTPIIVGMSTPITTNSLAHGEIASCCNKAFKIVTSSAAYLNNYFMLIGTEGVYSHTLEHEKRSDCPVWGGESLEVSISQDWTVERLIEMLVEKQDMCVSLTWSLLSFVQRPYSQIKKPSSSNRTKNIYISGHHHSSRRRLALI